MSTTARLRAIKGELPRKNEIAHWDQEKLQAFISFSSFFIDGDKFVITGERRKDAELRMHEEAFWMEFMVRIDCPFGKGEGSNQSFRMRFMAMLRTVLAWLKSNPHAISEEMRAIMQKSERMNWALDPFKEKTTKIGASIISVDNRETTEPGLANQNPGATNLTLPERQFNQALLQMTSLLVDLTRGISRSDLKKMSPGERIKVATGLAQTLQKSFATYKPNSMTFKKIVINNAGRDDLEAALLDYSQSQ